MGDVFELHVQLAYVEPPIWRRLVVGAGIRMDRLHLVLNEAIGFTNSHLHEFRIGERRLGMADLDDFEPPENEEDFALSDLADPGDTLRYVYDFGDDWDHEVRVVSRRRRKAGEQVPRCVDGSRAGPPEDSGGPLSYPDLLFALLDHSHKNHKETRAWAGAFDPEVFDKGGLNRRLLRFSDDAGARRDADPVLAAVWLAMDESDQVRLQEELHDEPPRPHPPPEGREMHAVLHATVETQLASGDPTEATEALARLRREGLDRHDAIHALASVLLRLVFEVSRGSKRKSLGPELIEGYRRLTAAEFLAMGDDKSPRPKRPRR